MELSQQKPYVPSPNSFFIFEYNMPAKTLNIPQIPSKKFDVNFIKTAVCELKFPTILEFEKNPPVDIQKKLRKDYPLFNRVKSLDVGLNKTSTSQHYTLHSSDGKWFVTIKPDFISLETTSYKTFEDFLKRLEVVLAASISSIDTDFFTRVGLRYINLIPIGGSEFKGFVNPTLVAPFENDIFGDLSQYSQIVSGALSSGRYNFRHGIKPLESDSQKPEYFLDFDYYNEMVSTDNVTETLKAFHEYNFSFFYWCLGEKSKKMLGAPKEKN
jgi:uncharacterized protein (TIGR04255 family)